MASGSQSDAFEFLSELNVVLNTEGTGISDLEKTVEHWSKILNCSEKSFAAAKAAIKGLTEKNDEEESKMASQRSYTAIEDQVRELKEQIEKIKVESDINKEEVEAAKKALKEKEDEYKLLREDREKCLAEINSGVPQVRYYSDLNKLITRVTWNLESPEDEVSGIIVNKTGPRPFNLNKKQHSVNFIRDYIWDHLSDEFE